MTFLAFILLGDAWSVKLSWHCYMLNFVVEIYIDGRCHESKINIRKSTWQWERIRLMLIIFNIYTAIEEQIFSPYWVLYIEWMLHYLGRWPNPQSLLTEHVISFMGFKFFTHMPYTEIRGLEWLYKFNSPMDRFSNIQFILE